MLSRPVLSRLLADQLRAELDEGIFRPGDQLPSYRDLATRGNIAVGTAREAVRLLEQEGRVEIRRGSGVYVREASAGNTVDDLRKIRVELVEVRERLNDLVAVVADAERRIGWAMSHIQPGAD